jgi:hypothetical protein
MKQILKNLSAGEVCSALVAGVPVAAIGTAAFGLQGLGMGVIAAVAARTWMRWKQSHARTIAAKDVGEWDVRLNEVQVGTMREADYAAICLQAYNMPYLYAALVSQLLYAALRVVGQWLIVIPIAAFWVLAALCVKEPGTFRVVVEAAAWSDLASIFGALTPLLSAVMLAVFGGYFLFGGTFSRLGGYTNPFAAEVAWLVRRHLDVAAEGRIEMQLRRPSGRADSADRHYVSLP